MKNRFFPNETPVYRKARDELLAAENALRQQTEDVAAMRRNLPPGGAIEEDYVFDEIGPDGRVKQTNLSELFTPGRDSLMLYGFMYGPAQEQPCTMCTSIVDGLNGNATHITQRMSLAIVARSPIERIAEFANSRGWNNLRMLSSANNTFGFDYQSEDDKANQRPMANVFVRRGDSILHSWGSELMFEKFATGNPRHVDIFWPLWNVLDLTPEGRGDDWYPSLSYED